MAPPLMVGRFDRCIADLVRRLTLVQHSSICRGGRGRPADCSLCGLLESPFVMPFAALVPVDIVACDVVAGQGAAKHATGKRCASGGRDGTGCGMA